MSGPCPCLWVNEVSALSSPVLGSCNSGLVLQTWKLRSEQEKRLCGMGLEPGCSVVWVGEGREGPGWCRPAHSLSAEEPKVGIKTIKVYCQRMQEENITRALIVVQQGMTPSAKQVGTPRPVLPASRPPQPPPPSRWAPLPQPTPPASCPPQPPPPSSAHRRLTCLGPALSGCPGGCGLDVLRAPTTSL